MMMSDILRDDLACMRVCAFCRLACMLCEDRVFSWSDETDFVCRTVNRQTSHYLIA